MYFLKTEINIAISKWHLTYISKTIGLFKNNRWSKIIRGREPKKNLTTNSY